MLKLHDLYKVYRTDEVETVALNGVNFEIEQGDFVAVMGPSGCGKSTLLNIVGLLDSVTEGSYFFLACMRRITEPGRDNRSSCAVGYL